MASRRLFIIAPLVLLLGTAACTSTAGSSEPPSPTSTAPASTPAQSVNASPTTIAATPTLGFSLGPDRPSGDRILELVRALSVSIGPRPAGSDSELAAAQYIAGLLDSFGYEVELQEFPIGREVARQSALVVNSPQEQTIPSLPFANSGTGTAKGLLVAAGLGSAAEIPPEAQNAVLLIERGDLFFQEKVANAQAAGAVGVIIFNNALGTFFGTLQTDSTIPAVSISRADGQSLMAQLADGPNEVDVEIKVDALSDAVSFNVIARPPARECETISGGHYDSVIQAAGASDNATGTATVIEVAAILAAHGAMEANCFVLFGAEEPGLIGSRAFVNSLSPDQRARIVVMLNFDMVGVGTDGWLLIGSSEEQQWALAISETLGIPVLLGQLASTTSSDHASFINAGIPALMLHRTTDNLLHTPQDTIERVRPELLEEAARLAVALLESLAGGT